LGFGFNARPVPALGAPRKGVSTASGTAATASRLSSSQQNILESQ
jgi:hypothetical protein